MNAKAISETKQDNETEHVEKNPFFVRELG